MSEQKTIANLKVEFETLADEIIPIIKHINNSPDPEIELLTTDEGTLDILNKNMKRMIKICQQIKKL